MRIIVLVMAIADADINLTIPGARFGPSIHHSHNVRSDAQTCGAFSVRLVIGTLRSISSRDSAPWASMSEKNTRTCKKGARANLGPTNIHDVCAHIDFTFDIFRFFYVRPIDQPKEHILLCTGSGALMCIDVDCV